jgi:hypothetical protein
VCLCLMNVCDFGWVDLCISVVYWCVYVLKLALFQQRKPRSLCLHCEPGASLIFRVCGHELGVVFECFCSVEGFVGVRTRGHPCFKCVASPAVVQMSPPKVMLTFFFYFYIGIFLCSSGWLWTCDLPASTPECWDCRCAPP